MESKKVLYIIVCAAPPAAKVQELIALAQQHWDVCVIATPNAKPFINVKQLEELTNHPVRIEYRLPGEEKQTPESDAILVMPATFNTINKWAAGIADNHAMSILCEALGAKKPIVAVPYMKQTLANHPAFGKSKKTLRKCGVYFFEEVMNFGAISHVTWNDILREIQLTNVSHG